MNTIQYLSTIKGCRMKKKCLHPVYAPSNHHTHVISQSPSQQGTTVVRVLYILSGLFCVYTYLNNIYTCLQPPPLPFHEWELNYLSAPCFLLKLMTDKVCGLSFMLPHWLSHEEWKCWTRLKCRMSCLFFVVGNSPETFTDIIWEFWVGLKTYFAVINTDILSYSCTALFCVQKRLKHICEYSQNLDNMRAQRVLFCFVLNCHQSCLLSSVISLSRVCSRAPP